MKKSELLQNAKPLLFNTEMVKAILDGRKTVTRRVIKPQPVLNNGFWELGGAGWSESISTITPVPYHSLYNRMPFKPGDILYVREAWCEYDSDHVVDGAKYAYKANATPNSEESRKELGYKWHPSIHMPKEAARIFLRVTDVRVERLQDIITGDYRTPGNINKEGIYEPCTRCTHPNGDCKDFIRDQTCRLVHSFAALWNGTVRKSGIEAYCWAANPWVWTVSFERVMFIVEREGRE